MSTRVLDTHVEHPYGLGSEVPRYVRLVLELPIVRVGSLSRQSRVGEGKGTVGCLGDCVFVKRTLSCHFPVIPLSSRFSLVSERDVMCPGIVR